MAAEISPMQFHVISPLKYFIWQDRTSITLSHKFSIFKIFGTTLDGPNAQTTLL